MSVVTDDPLSILHFWRDLEIFNIPTAPSARKDGSRQTPLATIRPGGELPWHKQDFQPTATHLFQHVVYLGVADTEDLTQGLLHGLFAGRELSEGERQCLTGTGWLAAFVVDEQGVPLPESYVPASFVHGVAALRETGITDNLNARLKRAGEEFAQRCQQPAAGEGGEQETPGQAISAGSLDWPGIMQELQVVTNLLGIPADAQAMDWRIVVKTHRLKRREQDLEAAQASSDFLNSFYLDDLDQLIAQAEERKPFGKALSSYLGPALDEAGRIDILANNQAMAHLVSAKRLPSARWPASSKHPLALAQQAAVAHVLASLGHGSGLVGINGPPGTGKTTLLCDVIAAIITERARRLMALQYPSDLFGDKTTIAEKSFFPIRAELIRDTSIVVTSTNNNAVKNITQELPARKKIAEEYGPVEYFAEVMDEVFAKQGVLGEGGQPLEAWGMIAAALGNTANRHRFAAGFFRDEQDKPSQPRQEEAPQTHMAGSKPAEQVEEAKQPPPPPAKPPTPTMKQVLEAAVLEQKHYQALWHQAKKHFDALDAELCQLFECLEKAEAAALRLDASKDQADRLGSALQALDVDIAAISQMLLRYQAEQANLRTLVESQHSQVQQRRTAAPPNPMDRLAAFMGRKTSRMASLEQDLEGPMQTLATHTAALEETTQRIRHAEAELAQRHQHRQDILTELATLEPALQADREALQAARASGTRHFPDAAFWSKLQDERHRASMMVNPTLDALRARLFLQAVELHRLTILANAGKFIANLRAVEGMLCGKTRSQLTPEQRPLLWDAFFFVVPVVSTTLASFDRLFAGMEQESLGWLLIDEAGQATPQSAAGALWRSRRAVIVGDPLQIEPVFTVPQVIAEDLARRHGVAPRWSPVRESVQTLADRITPYGSWVAMDDDLPASEATERIWTGVPLRTHRRCDDPMFSIANQIAYAGQMVQGRVDEAGKPKPQDFSCVLGESAWFDVRSSRISHPVCEEEIDHLLHGLEQLQSAAGQQDKIYVISPFRKVAQACRQAVGKAGHEGLVECGTVHTFQGKEAEIVFLVLGTAPGQAGAGARSWAASKPNLLNVAVTRAKCRFFVIGDASQWQALDYFRTLHAALPMRDADPGPDKSSLIADG